MTKNLLPFLIIVFCYPVYSQTSNTLQFDNSKILTEQKYNINERNKFDIIIPNSENKTPLVIFIHGGGFIMGNKEDAYSSRKSDIEFFLKQKVAFATINYSYYKNNDSLGVKNCLNDIKTAIQYIRFNAEKYNIDKERIALYGISAGAGSSLYFAFHDDFAIKGDSTLLGESTKVTCVGAIETQATYDLFKWMDYIPYLKLMVKLKKNMFYNAIANFYGYQKFETFEPHKTNITSSLDMLSFISSDDPPTYVLNLTKENFPKDFGIIQHHKAHVKILEKTLSKFKIEHQTYYFNRKLKKETDAQIQVKDFILKYLIK